MRHSYFLNAKRTLIALLVCVLLFAACTSPNTPASDPDGTKAPEQTEAPEPTPVVTEEPEPTPVPEPTAEPLDVPYYSYEQLMDENKRGAACNYTSDAYWESFRSGTQPNSIKALNNSFPDALMRDRDEHCRYYMVDIENNSRLFIFSDDHNDFSTTCGYAITVRQPLPYDAFADLAIGDPIEKVVSVDPAAELQRYFLVDFDNIAQYDTLFERFAHYVVVDGRELSRTVSTLHYLIDGVLRIDYLPNDAGELVISAMTYGADWKLPNAGGTVIDYRILPEDLDF